ncbi:MAG: hypothetical protein AAF570_04750 [Bacteroidota bacterium]
MNNSFKFPNPMMFMPFMKAADKRKYELRTRTYQSIAKFWTAVNWKLSLNGKKNEGEDAGQESRVRKALENFQSEIKGIFGDFKEGERYDELNMFEQWGDEMGKFAHRSAFWGGLYDRERIYEVYNAVEVFWDDFFGLDAVQTEEMMEMVTQFNEDVWEAFELEGMPPVPGENG